MQDINWGLLKFKHEVLGISLKSIAEEDNISPTLLDHCAKDWKQIPLDEMQEVPLNDINTFDEIISKLRTNTISQLQAFKILKDRFLASKYVELESQLLYKAIELMNSITSGDANAAKNIKAMADVLSSLKSNSPDDEDNNKGNTSREWKVTVVDGKTKE